MADTFAIPHTRFITADGSLERALPADLTVAAVLRSLYRQMVLTRTFDEKAIELQRSGRLGTYPPSLGQEAVGVGIAHSMLKEDVLVPSFREQAAQLYRGVTATELFLYWGGDERGSDFAGPREDFPISATVGGHAPHAAGIAMAFKLRREPRCAVCVFGDGATSKGDVYEAMNVAGLWQLPVLFIVTNNQWAISTPRSEQSAAGTLAQKAFAAGFSGEQVDGNDVTAVAHIVATALNRMRQGSGPHLIECLTYRLGNHTTVDDASRYRSEEEVAHWLSQDPILRLRRLLAESYEWTDADESELLTECRQEIDKAAAAYLAMPAQPAEAIFDYLYATLPEDLKSQRRQLQIASGLSEDG